MGPRIEPIPRVDQQARGQQAGGKPCASGGSHRDWAAGQVARPGKGHDRAEDGAPDRLDALVWGLTELFPSLVAPVGGGEGAGDDK